MKRSSLNFIIDCLLALSLLALLNTGLIMAYRLPPGSGRFLTISGLNRHEWGDVHFYIAWFFLILGVLHILLHLEWIASMAAQFYHESRAKTLAAAAVMLLLAGLCIKDQLRPVEGADSRTGNQDGHHSYRQQGDESKGGFHH